MKHFWPLKISHPVCWLCVWGGVLSKSSSVMSNMQWMKDVFLQFFGHFGVPRHVHAHIGQVMIQPSIWIYLFRYIPLSTVDLSIYPSLYLSIYLSMYISIYLLYPSIYLQIDDLDPKMPLWDIVQDLPMKQSHRCFHQNYGSNAWETLCHIHT